MPDKEVKIGFKTTADTSGAEEVREAVAGVNDEVEKAVKNADKATSKGKGESIVDGLVGDDKGGKGKLGRLKKLADRLKGITKAGARIGGLYTIITTVGTAFGGLVQKVSDAGNGIENFGDDMALTGQKGAGFVQWLGKKISALDGVGAAIKRTFNPIGAYIDSTRELAEAERNSVRVTEQLAASARNKIATAKKAIAILEQAEASEKRFTRATEEKTRANQKWEDSIDKASEALKLQLELLDAFRDRKEARVNRSERRELDRINRDLESGVISEEQAEKRKLKIRSEAATAREKIARKAFEVEQSVREKELRQQQDIARGARSEEISLQDLKNGFLSDEQRKRIEDQIKSNKDAATGNRKAGATAETDEERAEKQRLAREADQKAEALQEKLARSDRKGREAATLGFGSVEDVQARLDEIVERYRLARQKIDDITTRSGVEKTREQTRREGAVEDFKDIVKDGKNNISDAAARDQGSRDKSLVDLGKRATDIARKSNAPIEGINELTLEIARLEDGSTSSEREALKSLIPQLVAFVERTQGEKSELTVMVKQLERKLANQKSAR